MRILEVNNHSLLGMTHTEAVRVLRAVGDSLVMLVCDGFDPGKVAAVEVRWHKQSDLDMYSLLCTAGTYQTSDRSVFISANVYSLLSCTWLECLSRTIAFS